MLLKAATFKSTGHVLSRIGEPKRIVKPSLAQTLSGVKKELLSHEILNPGECRITERFALLPSQREKSAADNGGLTLETGNGANRALCGIPLAILAWLRTKLKRAFFFLEFLDNDTMRKVPGKTMGNKHYAWNQEGRISEAIRFMREQKGSFLWCTLTLPYINTREGIAASWKAAQTRLQPFLRAIRKLGVTSYITVKEAFFHGGCHIHVAITLPERLPVRRHKGKYRLDGQRGEQVRIAIKKAWGIGHVDVQVAHDEGAAKYLVKELGKAGHIEDALRRAERDWSREGDAKYKNRDTKKLWACYYASTLHVRRVTMSSNIKTAVAAAAAIKPPPDLITTRNNSTGPKVIRVVELPWSVRRKAWFQPFTGLVEPGSEEYFELRRLYGEVTRN